MGTLKMRGVGAGQNSISRDERPSWLSLVRHPLVGEMFVAV